MHSAERWNQGCGNGSWKQLISCGSGSGCTLKKETGSGSELENI